MIRDHARDLTLGLSLCLLLLTPGTQRLASAADAGDFSLVRQAVPLLLGRKVKGREEIAVLGDIAAAGGRGVMLRAIMAQPEFVDHWTEQFVDQMRIHRETPKRQTECFGARLRSGSDGGALARWVRDHPPGAGAAPGGPFNMSDLLRSAIELDDLFPAYAAYLFAMVNKPIRGNEVTEQNKRDDLGATFSTVYLHRQMFCLACHNSNYSWSGESSYWDRTHTILGAFERALYGSEYGRSPLEAHAVFRTDVTDGGATQPWGLHQDCGMFRLSAALPDDAQNAFFVRNHGRKASVWEVETALRQGYTALALNGLSRTDPDGDGVRDTLEPDAAFAYLVAANIVNQIWSEALGYPLTIPNYFPRNPRQATVLWVLTEFGFIPNRWSLKEVLIRILVSEFFNRTPPIVGGGTTAYVTPMLFDPWVENDPRFPPEALAGWTPDGGPPMSDPTHSRSDDPEHHNNAMTESVHRYSPRSLLYSIHAALGWPAPERFPSPTDYPNDELNKAIGQFFKDAEPGFRSVDFQGLLHWESVHGACAKPGGVGDDWIDRLIDAIPAFDATHAADPATISDLVQTMKAWLIGDATIAATAPVGLTDSEEASLVAHFGGPLNMQASTVATLEDKLRRFCGVLVETPQFMLAGIAPIPLGPQPRLRVCNGGPCSYREMCEAFKPAVDATLDAGRSLVCGDGTLSLSSSAIASLGGLEGLCPPGLCQIIKWRADLEGCLKAPKLCLREPPVCDPRCRRFDCCGGAMSPFEPGGVLLSWAEGALVQFAEGVRLFPAKGSGFRSLSPGTILSAGDLLELPPGSQVAIKSEDGGFTTPKGGVPGKLRPAGGPLRFLVTGESVLESFGPPPPEITTYLKKPSESQLEAVLQSEWLRYGEAGPLASPNRRKEFDPARLMRRDLPKEDPAQQYRQ